MNHDELIKEAEQLAEGKRPAELAKMGFIYAYVANHELRMLWGKIGNIERLITVIGIPIFLAIVLALLKLFLP